MTNTVKNIVSIVIVLTLVIITPRDLREAASFAIRLGVGLIQFGLALDPDGYEAGVANPQGSAPEDPNERA